MRSILVVVFLSLGALLTLSANATVWVNRTFFDEDEFVETVEEVLGDEDVQQQLSVRVADRIVEQGELEGRIQESLPEGLQFLAPLLASTAHDVVQRATLRILESDRIAEIFEAALRTVHRQVLYIIEGEGAVIFEDDQIIIDLGPVLQQVAEDLGRDSNGLLANLDLPEDAGQIVLVEDAPRANAIQDILSYHSQITSAIIAAALLCFAIAVLFARDRRAAIRNVGIVIAFCGVVAMVLLAPIRPIVAGLAENGDAGRAVFDAIVDRFQAQSFVLIVLGVLIAIAAALFGDTGLARAIRSSVRRDADAPRPDLLAEVRSSATFLRITGLMLGALALVAWPDPTDRVYATVLILLVAYFVVLWILTSQAEWAGWTRDHASSFWDRAVGGTGGGGRNESWFGRNSMALRIAGGVAALAALALVPNLELRSFAAIIALTLVYMAVVDWLATRTE